MKNKLTEKDLNLIMSLVDGELNTTDQQKAKNLISSNSEAKKAYDDMKLSSNFFSGYVSDIASDSDKIKSNQKTKVNKENIFNVIFQNPFRNFVAYPIKQYLSFHWVSKSIICSCLTSIMILNNLEVLNKTKKFKIKLRN